MPTRNTIQTKLLKVIMITCGSALVLTGIAYFVYEYYSYREFARRQMVTVSEIIAANSSSSLSFLYREDAQEVLHGSIRHFFFQAMVQRQYALVLRFNFGQHAVEGIGQLAGFIIGCFAGADGVVFFGADDPRGAGQVEYGRCYVFL